MLKMNEKETILKTKGVDSGWNDPPICSYESHEAHIRQTKGITLNKRIVFPLLTTNSPKTEQNSPTLGSIPPPSMALPPKNILKTSVLPSNTETLPNNSDSIDIPSVEIIIKNFNDTLLEVYAEDKKECIEIKRRLAIMEKMWNEEKFNSIIKEKIYKLSLALIEKRFDDGDCLQRSLSVDHSCVCSNWMAAVRKLLYRKKELSSTE